MFFFGYHCYMKKHGITQDTPNYPSDNEGEATGGFAREDGDVARIDPLNGQANFLCIFLLSSSFFLWLEMALN